MSQSVLMPIYPRLLRRVRAALIDSVVFVFVFFGWFLSIGVLENVHPAFKVGVLLLGVLILEPGLVSKTGGTIGHHMTGLRIQDSVSGDSVGMLRATVRAALRATLGALSLIFILATRKHQAIHDSVSRTVVVLRHPDRMPESERFQERELAPEGFELPSVSRRIAMILLYGLLSLVLSSVLIGLFVSGPCTDSNACSEVDDAISAIFSLFWFCSLVPIVIFAWKGRLFGCRRRPKEALRE